MALSVAEIMARAGLGSGGEVACTTLKGGLSHRVLRVDADGTSYVLRVLDPAVSAAGLGIPARMEIDNTASAALTGVGPAVLYVGEDLMVLEYIDGVTLGHDDVRRPAMIPRLAAACRRLHAGPESFDGDFSIFRKAEELFARCREHDLPVPDGYADHLPVLDVIERAMERVPLRRVPCHNDLLPENFIDAGRRHPDRRLPAVRHERPRLRARRHRRRGRLRPGPCRGADLGVLRRGDVGARYWPAYGSTSWSPTSPGRSGSRSTTGCSPTRRPTRRSTTTPRPRTSGSRHCATSPTPASAG